MKPMKIGDAPVFVKIEDYRDITDILEMIKDRIGEAKNILEDINELKIEEDSEIEGWRSAIADINQKIDSIDMNLFEQGRR